MATLNKVQLIGNLTRHHETMVTPGGVPILNNAIAINRKFKTKSGEVKEEVDFFDFVLFGQGAETFAKYTGKGALVYLEGRMKTERWEAEDGSKRSKIKVYADSFQFLKTEKPPVREQVTAAEREHTPPAEAASDDVPF